MRFNNLICATKITTLNLIMNMLVEKWGKSVSKLTALTRVLMHWTHADKWKAPLIQL